MVVRFLPAAAVVCATVAVTVAADLNCTVAAIEQFPRPLVSPELRKHGAIVVHVLAALYMFAALSIICEDYFVPSLEVICDGSLVLCGSATAAGSGPLPGSKPSTGGPTLSGGS
ncbi:hypothetical protein HPB50_000128 [Hyalomma asiaticum]|uniref:Uncharacterized protein n=1 Tax=Hyalomma asiaticum TaxID=266040 RepID=A0ACB7TCT5_HYAAI|nr:hypothetical protein HPB50_000128 [Hyalomma asiaticum]